MRASLLTPAVLLLLTLASGCRGRDFLDTGPCQDGYSGPALSTCDLAGWKDRPYDLVLPNSYDGSTPVPLLIALHGGGGNKKAAEQTTCSTGSIDDDSCLHNFAQTHGLAVVFPSGTGFGLFPETRTWNAGGGDDDWRCVSGKACSHNIDDIAYFNDLLDDVSTRVAVDTGRVYATGHSNGGAMTHRLACELSDRITAVAPVAGELQLITTAVCEPTRPVPILDVHGTDDPCWRYQGGEPDCPTGQKGQDHISVADSLAAWAQINGCDGDPTSEGLPDSSDDGTTTTRLTWPGCTAPVQHLRVDGGGHTWPNGDTTVRESIVGTIERDWGNELLWEFLSEQSMDVAR